MNNVAPLPTPTIAAGKTTAIINPMASSGAAKRRWERVREALEVHFPDLTVRFTEAQGHASILSREALEGGADTILSVGGDGTTNEVLLGFVDDNGDNRFPDSTLAVLAAGTGGDFQRMFGRGRIGRQVQRLCVTQPRMIDYGVARYTDPQGDTHTRPFLNVASVGVSGEVVRRVNSSDVQLGATLKYLVGSLRGIRGWRNQQVSIKYDNEAEGTRVDLTLGIVANGQYFGAGMWVSPDAKIDDGQFDAVMVTGMTRTQLTATLAKVFRGNHMRTKGISLRHATSVEFSPISPDADIPIEIDGEQVGRLPARFELRPARLKIRIS